MKKGLIILLTLTTLPIVGALRHVSNTGEFDAIINSGPAVVKFSATWCGPCKQVKAPFEDLAKENLGVEFIAIDLDQGQAIADRYDVKSVPTFLYINNGKVIHRETGAPSPFKDSIRRSIQNYLKSAAVAMPTTTATAPAMEEQMTQESSGTWQSIKGTFSSAWKGTRHFFSNISDTVRGWFK